MAISRLCSIPNCGKSARKRGWCNAHYLRWWSHGDPTKGRTREGEPLEYLNGIVLPYEGDDCLPWPFAKTTSGYGTIWLDGKLWRVGRLVCESANGPPPTPSHEAAHSCGNGHLSCCTKRHLSWKTVLENSADQVIHGTRLRGTTQNGAKLTDDNIREILSLKGTMPQRFIAKKFGVTQSHISRIYSGDVWSWL